MSRETERQAIIRAAREEGVDPAFALAVAQRESNFDTRARNSKTIRGAFQMTGGLRAKYGIGDSDDAYTQAKGWSKFIKDVRGEMQSGAGGREISDQQLYAGHHFGGVRAGRMLTMDPATPVDSVFSQREMSQNPHFAKAGTVGNLLGSVTRDIGRRQREFGGGVDLPDLAEFGEAAGPVQMAKADLSAFGDPAADPAGGAGASGLSPTGSTNAPSMPKASPQALPDFSSMGVLA